MNAGQRGILLSRAAQEVTDYCGERLPPWSAGLASRWANEALYAGDDHVQGSAGEDVPRALSVADGALQHARRKLTTGQLT